ncbi:glycosyltransferase [Paenibacillus humicus]|uniref:glycosyltransferase n=1 Tax=Paenibacillus humicus TaxID=412861 RepID=UPI003D266829
MDSHKICFIYCVSQQDVLQESLRHISALHIPDGFEIEIISVSGAQSITSGYNRAMRQSDAKYKVYLHQDVYIIHENFLEDTIRIFQQHPNLGLMGVIGSAYIPPSGMWWEAAENYGQVYGSHSGQMELLAFNNSEAGRSYQPVAAVDGLLIMTQSDIPWREDLFQDWDFYDLSQCMEFYRAGYEVGIPSQDTAWTVHDCGVADLSKYEENRIRFIQEYAQDIRKSFMFYYEKKLNECAAAPSLYDKTALSLIEKHSRDYEVSTELKKAIKKERWNTMSFNGEYQFSELLDIVKKTEGYLMELEILGLLHLPLLVDHLDGEIVEIGTFKGKSAIALGLSSQYLTTRKRSIHIIDPFYHPALPVNYEHDFDENIRNAGLEPHIHKIKKPSQEAYDDCPSKIAALFVDGDHSYDGVVHDIVHYASRVVPGGIIAFHDYSYKDCPGYEWAELPGVTKAVDEMCARDEYAYLCDYNSMRLVRKL